MINRRDFIAHASRNILFVALTFLSGILIFRRGDSSVQACNLDFVCKNCKKLNSCDLNEANDYKKVKNN